MLIVTYMQTFEVLDWYHFALWQKGSLSTKIFALGSIPLLVYKISSPHSQVLLSSFYIAQRSWYTFRYIKIKFLTISYKNFSEI